MSTAEEILASRSILTPQQRRSPVVLSEDPADEELARDWTLSEADKAEVLRCRTNRHRLSFAIQLCVLRAHGRFLSDYEAVGVRITNHLCRQLDLPPVLFVNPPQREATDLEHEHHIRDYLGFRPFDQTVQDQLERSVHGLAEQGHPVAEVFRRAEVLLRSWKIVLPAHTTLERIVASVTSQSRQEVIEPHRRSVDAGGSERDRCPCPGARGGSPVGTVPIQAVPARSQCCGHPHSSRQVGPLAFPGRYSGLPWCCTQSGMSEPAENVLRCHASQRLAHGIIEPRPSPRLGSTDALLDLREHLLDRGVVRAVRR